MIDPTERQIAPRRKLGGVRFAVLSGSVRSLRFPRQIRCLTEVSALSMFPWRPYGCRPPLIHFNVRKSVRPAGHTIEAAPGSRLFGHSDFSLGNSRCI